MDTEAFLPLRSEELASSIGTRVYQCCQLIKDVSKRLQAEGLASFKGPRATGGSGWYGKYMLIHDFGILLEFDAELWSRFRATPLWLRIWGETQIAGERLSQLAREQPPRMLRVESIITPKMELSIPLNLPVGEERDVVVESLLSQIREIASLLEQE